MLRKIACNFLQTLVLTLLFLHVSVAQTEKKIAYGVLIDNTGSLKSQFPEVLMIAKGIVGHVHQRGSISLFNFRTQGDEKNPLAVITPGTEWSQDKTLLERYIEDLYVVPGQTTLMDAINSVAGQVSAKAQLDKESSGDKIIFLITDGEDRVSKIKEKQLIKSLQESGVKVYAVGLVEELDSQGGYIRQSAKVKSVDFLKKITKETGGRVIFPKLKKRDVSSLLAELFAK
jgi:hypothetical protein